MRIFLLLFCLAGCMTPAKTLRLQQQFVNIADSTVAAWINTRSDKCISLAAEEIEPMDYYFACSGPIFKTGIKIAVLIDSIRSLHKVEAGTLLAIARGELAKEELNEITPQVNKLLGELTSLVGSLK